MKIETTGSNATDHLDSDSAILAYLEAAFVDGHLAPIAAALVDVAKVRRIASPLAPNPDIGLDSVTRARKALGLELTAKAA